MRQQPSRAVGQAGEGEWMGTNTGSASQEADLSDGL